MTNKVNVLLDLRTVQPNLSEKPLYKEIDGYIFQLTPCPLSLSEPEYIKVGTVVQPISEERILELAKKYFIGTCSWGEFIGADDMKTMELERNELLGFVREIEKELLCNKNAPTM